MRRNLHSDERLAQIYDVVKTFLMEKGYPPSVREIGTLVGLKSSSTVHGYLAKLEEIGRIRRDPTKPRAIDLVEDQAWKNTKAIPLLKKIVAGKPVVSNEFVKETHAFPLGLIDIEEGDSLFMLKASDNSLSSHGVEKGDILIVKEQDSLKSKDLGVVFIGDGNSAVVRYCSKDGRNVLLINDKDANDNIKNATVVGKVISVLRNL